MSKWMSINLFSVSPAPADRSVCWLDISIYASNGGSEASRSSKSSSVFSRRTLLRLPKLLHSLSSGLHYSRSLQMLASRVRLWIVCLTLDAMHFHRHSSHLFSSKIVAFYWVALRTARVWETAQICWSFVCFVAFQWDVKMLHLVFDPLNKSSNSWPLTLWPFDLTQCTDNHYIITLLLLL